MELVTINEIDSGKGICSPHSKELQEIGKNNIDAFKVLDENKVDGLVELVGGRRQDLDQGEEWTVSKQFFPGVTYHVSYHYYGEEFSSVGEEAALRFLFSGDKVTSVPGEDLAGMVEKTVDYLHRELTGKGVVTPYGDGSENLASQLDKRSPPFSRLNGKEEKLKEAADFVGAEIDVDGDGFRFLKTLFPGIETEIRWREYDGLEASFSGERLSEAKTYEVDSLALYTVNHLLRYVYREFDSDSMPEIVEKMFP